MGEKVGKALYCRNCIARGLAREVCIAIHCCVLQQAVLARKLYCNIIIVLQLREQYGEQ